MIPVLRFGRIEWRVYEVHKIRSRVLAVSDDTTMSFPTLVSDLEPLSLSHSSTSNHHPDKSIQMS